MAGFTLRRLFPLGIAALAAAPVLAQSRADSSVVLRGTVYDSLVTGGPLGDAEVWLDGTNRSARTDGWGRFEFTGLAAGRYTLTFFHPVLDSAGFSARPVSVDVDPALPVEASLTTPSPRTLHRALCPGDPLAGRGVLLGLVRNSANREPFADASVTAEWTDLVVEGPNSRWEPRASETRSDQAGRVVLCDVPNDVTVLLRGQAPDGHRGFLTLDLAGREFGQANLEVSMGEATGSVLGILRRPDGEGVAHGGVRALETDLRASSDSQGRFTLTGVPAGSQVLEAHAVGFTSARIRLTVPAGGVAHAELVLADSAYVLAPVTVTGITYLQMIGFERRRKSGDGHFLDQKDIARTKATRIEEVFRLVPGVQLRPAAMGYVVEMQRGQGQIFNPALRNYCQPSYFIDGQHFALPPNANQTLPLVPDEVLAIEVYSDLSSAPLQYQRRDSGCGVILIWTKRGIPNRP